MYTIPLVVYTSASLCEIVTVEHPFLNMPPSDMDVRHGSTKQEAQLKQGLADRTAP